MNACFRQTSDRSHYSHDTADTAPPKNTICGLMKAINVILCCVFSKSTMNSKKNPSALRFNHIFPKRETHGAPPWAHILETTPGTDWTWPVEAGDSIHWHFAKHSAHPGKNFEELQEICCKFFGSQLHARHLSWDSRESTKMSSACQLFHRRKYSNILERSSPILESLILTAKVFAGKQSRLATCPNA